MTGHRGLWRRSVHPRTPGGGFRRLRVAAGVGLLGIGLAASVALIPPTVSYAAEQAVALDRQAYVPDAGADQYQVDALSGGGCGATVGQCPAPDPNAIHVAADPNTQTYHSLLHVELNALQGETVTSLVVTLSVINPATLPQDNVNTTAAIIDAYPLATEFPTSFTGCSTSASCTAPAVDTNGPKVVGKVATDAAGNIVSFSFDVGRMLPYWTAKGTNTGFAVVPDAGATTQPWAIAFDRTQGTATATTTSSQQATSPPITTAPARSSGGGGGSGGGSGFQSTAPTAAAATPTPKPSPAHAAGPIGSTNAGGGGGGTGGTGIPLWLLVLGVSCAASVALLAQPVSQALSSSGGLRLGLVRELKIHPRMFAVAGTVLVWSSAWGVYAGATNAGSVSGNSRPAVAAAGNSSIPSYAPDATSTPGPTAPGASGGGGSGGGGGGGSTINGHPVGAAAFAGANVPNAPAAHLYSGADDTVGITNTSIQLCAHSALTFGPAFNIGVTDLNVFWKMVNDPATDPYPHTPGQGGIYNRKIQQPDGTDGIAIQDDGYQPSKAVTAAAACRDQSGGDFVLLSGIGFDQIPNVRVWAEQNHMLYIHHIATQQGTGGLQYSFTMLPSLEQIGAQYAQYYLSHMRGKTIGIVERGSSNWSPGIAAFRSVLRAAGQEGNIKVDDQVQNNQGDYSKQIVDLQTGNNGAAVDTVLIWENALAADSLIQQAANQTFVPANGWFGFPFNLTLYTLNQSSSNTSMQQEIRGMQGLIPWPAYTSSPARCASGGSGITRNDGDYAKYLGDIKEFESVYGTRDASADMCGDGGDLLFATWEAWKQVADLLVQCGPDCSRNRIAGLMLGGYKSQVGANCPVDFSGGDHHHGGTGGEDVYATKPENGGPGWVNTGYCETTIR